MMRNIFEKWEKNFTNLLVFTEGNEREKVFLDQLKSLWRYMREMCIDAVKK
jgi:hypothetical protein